MKLIDRLVVRICRQREQNWPELMNNNNKVLVVGTTSDYIDWIRQANPGRAIFLTSYDVRDMAVEPEPHPSEEILCCLEDADQVKKQLLKHLERWQLTLDGISGFDCESLELAAVLAKELSLPYPSVESIRLCRDKYVTKTTWQQKGVLCPRAQIVQSADGVFAFLQEVDGPCVVKPISGTGSELVFYCASRKDCDMDVQIIKKGLAVDKSRRMYTTNWFLVEEYIHGTELSCDFLIRDNQVQILRLTRKIKNSNKPFGTIAGYLLSDANTEGIYPKKMARTLLQAAAALGISEAICMVDFIVRDDEIILLEMTPRPGGDCIPYLLRQANSMDMLTYALDFAQKRELPPLVGHDGQYVGVRLHAGKSGTIMRIDDRLLQQDSRVLEIHGIRKPGHTIKMPPQDYESWYLGHIIVKMAPGIALEQQVKELSSMLVVDIDHDQAW